VFDIVDARYKHEDKCGILVWKYKGKGQLLRPGHRWDVIFCFNMKEVDNKDVDWIHLANHSVLCSTHISMVINLQFP
jgi:hypothetical protein